MTSSIRHALACIVALAAIAPAPFLAVQPARSTSDRARLIGAWHLVSLQAPGPDGKMAAVPGLNGILIYTRDGHVSVQVMYPESQASLSNDYVRNGYEASFGTYSVNQSAHTVTHHVQGSITPQLVGKDLPRKYQFVNGRLVIRSVNPDEHWSATWQHDERSQGATQ